MSVEAAVKADLDSLPEQVRSSGLAAAALTLASMLDEGVPARDAAAVGRELRQSLAALRDLARAAPTKEDPLDELEKRRSARVTGSPIPDGADSGKVIRKRSSGTRGKRGSDTG